MNILLDVVTVLMVSFSCIPKSGIGTFKSLVHVLGGGFYIEHLFFCCCFLAVF